MYSLPLIPELITQVRDAWVYTKFDIRWGYNNICIREGDQWKAAFKTCFGLFQPEVMTFGQCNSPATFQTFMNMIMIHIQDKHSFKGTEIIVYMDDILIAMKEGATIEDHWATTMDVLQVLQDHDLFLKLEKCVWESPCVNYLGLILEKGVTSMDPAKVEGVKSWPTPSMVKQVHSFLGFCNFYHAFIRGFSHLAKPLNELTKKDHPWTWEQPQQDTFNTLKSCIIAEPVHMQPCLDQPFELKVDSSGFAQEAVLRQKGEDGKRHPVAFYSKTLTEPE